MRRHSFLQVTLTQTEQLIHNKMGKNALVSFPEPDIKDSVSKSQSIHPEIQAAIKVVKDILEKK